MVKRAAFTLVELLVVISIIALLLSVLMPALGRVRQSGYRVVCASNMSQISLGLQMYAGDNKGYVVPMRFEKIGNIDNFQLSWDQTAAEYFSAKKNDSLKKYLTCPADRKPRVPPLDTIYKELLPSGKVLARSYMLNGALQNTNNPATPPPWFGNGTGAPARDLQIDTPGEVIWFVECHVANADTNYGVRKGQPGWEGGIQGTNYWPTSWWPPTVKGFFRPYGGIGGIATQGDQHQKGGNWAYMDGSVKWFGYKSAPQGGGTIQDVYKAYSKGPVYPFSWAHSRAMRLAADAAGFTR